MKKYVALSLLLLMFAASLDAAPRSRRRARRQARRNPPTNQVRYQTQPVYRAVASSQPSSSSVVSAEYVESSSSVPSVGDPLPNVDEPSTVLPASATRSAITPDASPASAAPTTVSTAPQASAAEKPAAQKRAVSKNAALAELNALRARRGLRPFVEDPRLTTIALHKAQIQASRGQVYHPGGTMGGARFEGVGMGQSFATCYQYATNATYAGAATVRGANGRRYHCLLLR